MKLHELFWALALESQRFPDLEVAPAALPLVAWGLKKAQEAKTPVEFLEALQATGPSQK